VVPTACRVGSIQLRLRRDRCGRLILLSAVSRKQSKQVPESSRQFGRSMICRLALARHRPMFIIATSSNTRITT